jgi:hypothetical protein
MLGVPPQNCAICYHGYNNEKVPIILVTCGHTFCKECLEMIYNQESKEVICPECKQSTLIDSIKNLPKNRALFDSIIYNEHIMKEVKLKKEESLNISSKMSHHNLKRPSIDFLLQYQEILTRLEETYNNILKDHPYLTEISDVFITKEVDTALDNLINIINQYREALHLKIKNEFHKVNLIKEFKTSINQYKKKLKYFQHKIQEISQNRSEIEVNNRGSQINNDDDLLIKLSQLTDVTLDIKDSQLSFSDEDLENLKNEIVFAELYSVTLKAYSKEIYNPCKYFFLNKFQEDKLVEDLEKLMRRVCDFDENVHKYNLESLNSFDEKKIFKEIQETCNQANIKKLKYIFSHLRVNPNFIYSDVLDQLTCQTSSVEVPSSYPTAIFGGQPLTFGNTSNTGFNRNNLPVNNNTQPRVTTIRVSTSNSFINNNIQNYKDKVYNLYTFIKQFKEKNEISELIKFFIEEYNYLPLKIEAESNVEVKFGRDFDWKINLNIL